MDMQKLKYWLPRIFVFIFAISLLLPAPDFVSSMDDHAFMVWLARLIWVMGVPVIFCVLILFIAHLTKTARSQN